MMKWFILLVSFSVPGFAQVNDSLLYQIQSIENDTERVNGLYQNGFELRNINPELSYRFAVCCYQEAKKCHSAKHLAKSFNLLGVLFYKKGDYTKALQFQKQALFLNQSIHYDYGVAINQTNLGNIYTDVRYFTLAETAYLQAMQAYNRLGHKLQLARCLINIGVLKYNQKQPNAAIKQFEEALVYATAVEDQELIASCYNNIGDIYRNQGKLDSALMYLEESFKLRNLAGNELGMADSYNNLALIYMDLKKYDQANSYIMRSEFICQRFEDKELETELCDTKALLYEAQQKYEQALFWKKRHHWLKDSLQETGRETNPFLFSEEALALTVEGQKKPLTNVGLLILLSLFCIMIPLFLIRYKR